MILIREEDLVESVSAVLQYMSYYHPPDFLRALAAAHDMEKSPAAKDAIAQILANSRMCAEGRRPLCQDTGIVNVFVKWGQECLLKSELSLQEVIDKGGRRAYLDPNNPLRASIVSDPAFERRNTGDNTPCVVDVELVPGPNVEVTVAAKGGGSENKARLAMLGPADPILDWVLASVREMGAGWCPPGTLGIGIGGTAEQAVRLAKRSLMAPIDMPALKQRGAATAVEALRIRICDEVNALGVGAQGLGGLTTVLDVKVQCWPTHAASKPVAIIPNCAASRHAHIVLDGSGPTFLQAPRPCDWPNFGWSPPNDSRVVNLDALTQADVSEWRAGERLLLSGTILTGRDAAHVRIEQLLREGSRLPVSLEGRVLYYVGPVDPIAGEVVGPAGPTTAARMDRFLDSMLERTGLLATIGKGERSEDAIATIKRHGRAYLIAVGGAAYLVSKAIREARVVAFPDLGMEAIYEFVVQDMPVMVAIDSLGQSLHASGPLFWRERASNRI